ncbi:MAG: site-specific integrase, partial [Pyrinomonadaceae bacterium]
NLQASVRLRPSCSRCPGTLLTITGMLLTLAPESLLTITGIRRHKTREIQALTREDAARLMAVEKLTRTEKRQEGERTVVVDNRYRVLFAFLLTTGARPSEAFGLKWADIDMEKGIVSIQRTLQWHSKAEGGGWYYSETKTKGSRRTVPLPVSLIEQLKAHRASQAEALLKFGIRTDIVFATSEGTPILRRNLVRRHFKPALLAAKLPAELSLYSLRHSCATLLLQAGTHPKIVAERLGHSSTTLTMDVYSHVAPGMQSDATAQLERMLYG